METAPPGQTDKYFLSERSMSALCSALGSRGPKADRDTHPRAPQATRLQHRTEQGARQCPCGEAGGREPETSETVCRQSCPRDRLSKTPGKTDLQNLGTRDTKASQTPAKLLTKEAALGEISHRSIWATVGPGTSGAPGPGNHLSGAASAPPAWRSALFALRGHAGPRRGPRTSVRAAGRTS